MDSAIYGRQTLITHRSIVFPNQSARISLSYALMILVMRYLTLSPFRPAPE